MAAAPERSSRHRSADCRHGANHPVFDPRRLATHINVCLGGQALLANPEPWLAIRDRIPSAVFDASSLATGRSTGCIEFSAARECSVGAVLRFIVVPVDAVVLVIRTSEAIPGRSSSGSCVRLENLPNSLFALFPSEERPYGLCRWCSGGRGYGCRISPCIWLGAESYFAGS